LEITTGIRGGLAPPITYQLDGKQYITFAGGQGTVPAFGPPPGATPPAGGAGPGAGRGAAPAGAGPGAGAPGAGAGPGAPGAGAGPGAGGPGGFPTPPPPSMPKLLTFVLDGKAPLPVAPAPPAASAPPGR